MMIDDWNSGVLPPDDPWAVEALKRGLIQPREQKTFDESAFQTWYKDRATMLGINPNPDDPKHFYDYRAAYKAGAEPGPDKHWPSEFKTEGHPRMVVDGANTKTGERAPYNPFTNPDLSPKETRSISPNPPEPGRNLAEPYLPGTKAFTKRVNDWQPPNPLTTKVEDNPLLMGALGTVGPIETELWHGFHYPKTFKGFRLEGDPQKWGAVQYSQIDKGSNAAPITFYVKPGQDLETRLAEVMAKFGGKK